MKMRSILAAAVLTAAALTGCGDKKTESAGESEEVTEAAAVTEAAPEEEMPTDRVREIEEITDFEYEILDSHAVITRYTGSSADVTVPSEIEGIPVTEIGYYAFEAKFLVENVVLPESVNLICEYAFSDCSSLKSINIPDAVTGIQRGAFGACTSLEAIVIPKNTTYIQQESFTACTAMTSMTINNPDLAYEDWGLEDLPNLTIYAEEGSAVSAWAGEKGFNVQNN